MNKNAIFDKGKELYNTVELRFKLWKQFSNEQLKAVEENKKNTKIDLNKTDEFILAVSAKRTDFVGKLEQNYVQNLQKTILENIYMDFEKSVKDTQESLDGIFAKQKHYRSRLYLLKISHEIKGKNIYDELSSSSKTFSDHLQNCKQYKENLTTNIKNIEEVIEEYKMLWKNVKTEGLKYKTLNSEKMQKFLSTEFNDQV